MYVSLSLPSHNTLLHSFVALSPPSAGLTLKQALKTSSNHFPNSVEFSSSPLTTKTCVTCLISVIKLSTNTRL